MNKMTENNISSRVGTIYLSRPEKRNALHPQMVSELKQTFQEFRDDDSVKIIVLRGRGDVFCAGADLSVIKALKTATYEENHADSKSLAELFDLIYTCPKPVIAAVHGHAIAGGCGLATICDIIIASDEAKFGYTETRIGFVPAIVAQFLIRKTGQAAARHLLLSGSLIDAKEAEKIGLITKSVKAGAFEEELQKLLHTLLEKTSGEALQATKLLINEVSDLSYKEAIEHAITINAKARGSKDCQRGIEAFLNKTKIIW